MRLWDQLGGGRPINANSTVTFTGNEIPGDGVIQYGIGLSGTGGTVGNVERVRVKANGRTIIDLSNEQLRGCIASATNGAQEIGTNDFYLPVPLNMLGAPSMDAADVIQFPRGANPTVEIVFGGTGDGSGLVFLNWGITDQPYKGSTMIIASALNAPASTNNFQYQLQQAGTLAGIGIPRTGLGNLELVVGGEQIIDVGVNSGQGMGLYLMTTMYGAGKTSIDFNYVPIRSRFLPAVNSHVNIDTLAGWAGASNELLRHTYQLAPAS